jgi:hypothetical protein
MISGNGDPFKAYLLSQGRVPGTVGNYLHYLRQWEAWCATEAITPVTATASDISRWLQGQNGLCGRTLPSRLTALRAYYAYATDTGLRADDPTGAGCLKMFLPTPAITDPDVECLLAEAEALDGGEAGAEDLDHPLDVAEVRRIFAQVLDALGSVIGMNASVNELLRQAALFVEVEGWASPGLLERRLRVNRHIAKALVETLRDEGILKEEPQHWLPKPPPVHRYGAQGTWKDRRKNPTPFICAECGQDFEPGGANQKRCPVCRGMIAGATQQ